MRFLLAFSASTMALASVAFAQTVEEVKNDVLSALSTPLPITVVGPVMASDVVIAQEGASFRATLDNAMLLGVVPLGSLSFKLTPEGARHYRVTDFALPKSIDFLNKAEIGIGSTKFDGLWSAETRSYETLAFELGGVSVAPRDAGGGKISIGTLALDVAKEGTAGAAESRFALSLKKVTARGVSPANVAIAEVAAELQADGKEPVDLYAVLARFTMLTAMQSDGHAALQFAESLRAKDYAKVNLTMSMNGLDVRDAAPGSELAMLVQRVTGTAEIIGITPDNWNGLKVNFAGAGIRDTGFLDVRALDIDEGAVAIDGARIPIGATLNTIGQLRALGDGEQVAINVGEVLDGILGIGGLSLSSSAKGIVFKPMDEEEPEVKVGSYTVSTGVDGFADKKGRLLFSTKAEGIDLGEREFDSPLDAQSYALFSPTTFNYDVAVSELDETLLRRMIGDLVVRDAEDAVGLAAPAIIYAMALKPVIETRAADFASKEFSVSSSGKLRLYPAWFMEPLFVEGQSKLKLTGIDKIRKLLVSYGESPIGGTDSPPEAVEAPVMPALAEGEQSTESAADAAERAAKEAAEGAEAAAPDVPADAVPPPATSAGNREGAAVMLSVLTTLEALGTREGDSVAWDISYPKAGQGLIVVNGTELRFPGLTGAFGLPMLMGMGMYNP